MLAVYAIIVDRWEALFDAVQYPYWFIRCEIWCEIHRPRVKLVLDLVLRIPVQTDTRTSNLLA